MKTQALICLILLSAIPALAQVDEIKQKSSENADKKPEGNYSSSSSGKGFFFFDIFRLVGQAQSLKLQKHEEVRRVISLETFYQGAVQPSNYYLFNPRIRGNWGLFSSDFRLNYLIEQSDDRTTHDLSTFDWQILQLNLITNRNFTGRIGGGELFERFGGKQSFFEWTAGLSAFLSHQTSVVNIEYRVAKDYSTQAVPRREINFSIERQIFNSGPWRGYLTFGGVYQRYYQTVSVWGLQAGLAIRVF